MATSSLRNLIFHWRAELSDAAVSLELDPPNRLPDSRAPVSRRAGTWSERNNSPTASASSTVEINQHGKRPYGISRFNSRRTKPKRRQPGRREPDPWDP